MNPQTRTFPYALLAALVVLLLNLPNVISAFHHQYYAAEPDAYMRMFIVSDLLNNHQWYQHFIARIDPQLGSDTHYWTRAVDVLIIAGVFIFQSFMPVKEALLTWCFILPPLTFFCAALAMRWAIQPLKPDGYQQLFIVLAFLLNPLLGLLFAPLNVDYDFLVVFLSIVYWGCLLRALDNHPRAAIAAGFIAALGTWTSMSFFLIVLVSLGWLFLTGKRAIILSFLITLTAGLLLFTLIEQANPLAPTYDILSIVHVTFSALLLVGFVVFTFLQSTRRGGGEGGSLFLRSNKKVPQPTGPRRVLRRVGWLNILVALGILLVIFCTMQYFFPGFYRGPYNGVDPYLLTHFFPIIVEFFSPFSLGGGIALCVLIYFLISMAFFITQPSDPTKHFLLTMTGVLTVFTLYMYRWNNYAGVLNIFLVSFWVAYVVSKLNTRVTKYLFIAAVAFLPLLCVHVAPRSLYTGQQFCIPQTYALIQQGFFSQPQFRNDRLIMADSNYAPYLLFLTRYSVIAGNYHHDLQGIRDMLMFFNGDEETAKTIALHRQVDLVFYCVNEQRNPKAFLTSLSQRAHPPAWLSPIPLPKEYSALRLYRVKNESLFRIR